jgi:predicted ATP-grasp superfamily ATP-dependent carboligase
MKPIDSRLLEADRPVAIVYPAHTLAAYAVIRNLGERGVPVLALNPTTHPHMRSRWVTPMLSPGMADDPAAFFEFLSEVADQLPHGAVLYLLEDVYVYLAHKFRAMLPPNVRFSWMDDEALAMSLDKRAMFDAAERAGVPLPWTCYPTSLEDLEAQRDAIPFPCIMKPLVSRFSFTDGEEAGAIELFPRSFGGKCVQADSWEELKTLYARARSLAIPVCVQELLVGPIDQIYGVHLYADAHHEILGAVTGRKIRQVPGDFGTGTLCEVVHHDEALALAKAFVNETRYHGIAGIEFKADPRTGELKLIEINPRGVHWLGVCRVGGVELPYLKYADLLGTPIRQEQTCFSGKWVDGAGDLKYLKQYGPDSESPYHVDPVRWLASMLGASPAVLNPFDPLPGLLKMIPKPVGARYMALKQRLSS